jgi:acyl dehydratase
VTLGKASFFHPGAGVSERGLFYEELEPGRQFRTAGRLVTQADVAAFADVSGDRNPLHLDESYARESVFGQRVAHGVLGLAVATGLINAAGLTRGTLVAFLGVTWDFVTPLYPDTEVRVELEVVARRETSHPDRGLVVLGTSLVAGTDEVVQRGELRVLVRRRASAPAA